MYHNVDSTTFGRLLEANHLFSNPENWETNCLVNSLRLLSLKNFSREKTFMAWLCLDPEIQIRPLFGSWLV